MSRKFEFMAMLALNALVFVVYFSNISLDSLRSLSPRFGFRTRINACIVVLVRNQDLNRLLHAINRLESHFNHKHHYPYVLFNNEPFLANFRRSVRAATQSRVQFGLIPASQWSVPKWVRQVALKRRLKSIGFSLNYRHMCRFYSGFFFRHKLTSQYDYFMRIDDDSDFPCPIEHDPFETLISNNKTYGFALGASEGNFTIPTLWSHVLDWLNSSSARHPPAADNTVRFVSEDGGKTLAPSMCTFYNNFEVAAFSVFRSQAYIDYFNYLDRKSGFFYERWGDAPVHTYYVNWMLDKSQVHMFRDVPYRHRPFGNIVGSRSDTNCSQPLTFSNCSAVWIAKGF